MSAHLSPTMHSYRGRFAPSPTGPLHQGSLVAAMASYLDAKTHAGRWLVRIEDIDETRTVIDADHTMLHALQTLGMQWDEEVVWQSQRKDLYQTTFDQLTGYTYPCSCSRREIADSHSRVAADGAAIYPGTCRHGLILGKIGRTLRLRVPDLDQEGECITFEDAWLGSISQHLALEVGDFVLKRADGFWAYQLAVVIDDARQGITHIVRGADLLDSTARQIYLQRLLHLPTPHYMHVPLILDQHGEKLSKQTGAQELNLTRPLDTLVQAAEFLGLPIGKPESIHGFWQAAALNWHNRYGR